MLGDAVPRAAVNAVATPGGTGAVRQAFELIKTHQPLGPRLCLQPDLAQPYLDPGISRHGRWCHYRYFDTETRGVDFDGMMADLRTAQKGDVMLLHGCCHNPRAPT